MQQTFIFKAKRKDTLKSQIDILDSYFESLKQISKEIDDLEK